MENLLYSYHVMLAPALVVGWHFSYMECLILFLNISAIWLAAKNTAWTGPVYILSLLIYSSVCFYTKFYSEFFMLLFFIVAYAILIGSWLKEHPGGKLPIRKMTPTHMMLVCALWLLCTWVLGTYINEFFTIFSTTMLSVLSIFTGKMYEYIHVRSIYPYIDAYIIIGQIISMLLMMRRYLQNWLTWLIVDIICVPMFIAKGAYGIALMFVIFCFLSVYGFFSWKRIMKEQNTII